MGPTDLTIEEVSESMVSICWEEPDFTDNIIEFMWSIVLSGDEPAKEPSIVASGILPVGKTTHMVSLKMHLCMIFTLTQVA